MVEEVSTHEKDRRMSAGAIAMVARYDRAMQSRSVPDRAAMAQRPARPTLIVVSGAPGSGKTTLARRIADELALPLISKDAIKESLADAVGLPQTVEESSRLGTAAYAAMFALASATLDAGGSAVLDSNFRRGRSEEELVVVAAGRPVLVVHCEATAATIERRYRGRASTRHPCHLDQLRTADVQRDLADGRYQPLSIPDAQVLVVDTDGDETPAFGPIWSFVSGPITAR
jgi:predicted kinase